MSKPQRVAILGTVGVPGNYGGFETLVENLVRFHADGERDEQLFVYCSSKSYDKRPAHFLTAKLLYIPLRANGAQSIPYDILSLISAVNNRNDVILLLGVSGAIALPFIRLFSSVRIITNVDGIEWRRQKRRGFAKWFLRYSEKIAVLYSHEIIADNRAIANYLNETYGTSSVVIAYGGDHAVSGEPIAIDDDNLPETYALGLCRIEPENNVHVILEAFAGYSELSLIFVGNWKSSEYGRQLFEQYCDFENLYLLDPIYETDKLLAVRGRAQMYIHGHSAGGTNPSLVEMMHFGVPILAFDCMFNRFTTDDKAVYFKDATDLVRLVKNIGPDQHNKIGSDMLALAQECYTWAKIGKEYFKLLTGKS